MPAHTPYKLPPKFISILNSRWDFLKLASLLTPGHGGLDWVLYLMITRNICVEMKKVPHEDTAKRPSDNGDRERNAASTNCGWTAATSSYSWHLGV